MRRRLLLKAVLGCATLLARGISARAQESPEPQEPQEDEVSNLGEILNEIH